MTLAKPECAPGFHSLDYKAGPDYWTSCVVCGRRWAKRPRLASEMPDWVGNEPPPGVLTEDDSWDRWPAS